MYYAHERVLIPHKDTQLLKESKVVHKGPLSRWRVFFVREGLIIQVHKGLVDLVVGVELLKLLHQEFIYDEQEGRHTRY